MLNEGYHPFRYGPDYACGIYLNSLGKGYRFIIFSGNHRIGVCVNLKINKVLVYLGPEYGINYYGKFYVSESQLDKLQAVRNDNLSITESKMWFDFYFQDYSKQELMVL